MADEIKLKFYGESIDGMTEGFHVFDEQKRWVLFEDAQEAIHSAIEQDRQSRPNEAWERIVEMCVVTEAVTPNEADVRKTLNDLIDYHVQLDRQSRDDGVRALIAKLREQAKRHGVRQFTGNDHALFANELEAALTPTNKPADDDWLPIESAPRSGRQMILLLTPSRFPQVAFSNTWWMSGFSVECKPTHWMPIPELPTNGAGHE